MASLGIWIFGFGGFPNTEFVPQTADSFGLGGAPDWVVIATFVVLTGTTGMLSGVAAATGPALPDHRGRSCMPATTSGCSIFTPLTTDKDYTNWITGDLGLAFELPSRACG